MSDEDFFRDLRDDIVNTTSKIMEGSALSSGCEATMTMLEVGTANLSVSDKEKGSTSVPPPGTLGAEGNEGKKVAMEFVQLSVENQQPKKAAAEKTTVTFEENPAEPTEPPPGIPEIASRTERKKGRRETKLEKLASKGKEHKETKQKKSMHKDLRLSSSQKKEAKGARSNSARGEDKLMYLTNMINDIKNQIDAIKEGSKLSVSKPGPAPDDGDSRKTEKSSRKHDEAKPAVKENKTKSARSDAKSHKKESKRKDKKEEMAGQLLPKVDETASNSTGAELSAEQRLLLKLFTLSSSQRRKYIEKRGVEIGLLEPHPFKKHVILVSERVQQVSEGLFTEAQDYIAARARDAPKESERAAEENTRAAKQEDKTFEQQVNYLLNNGKECPVEDYNPDLLLSGIRNEAHTIVQDRLESFVEQLVAKNVGYLVEGILRVNARNNLQSFVDDPTREGNVYINSVLLRRCGMDGDFVKVFTVNRAVVPPTAEEEAAAAECLNDTVDSVAEDTVEEKSTLSQNNAGFVVKILEKRHNRQCVGKFSLATSGKKHYRTFVPRDTRIPTVRIFKQDWPNALIESTLLLPAGKDGGEKDEGQTKKPDTSDIASVLYQAQIIYWQDDVPIGIILRSIGKSGELEAENESILVEHNLDVTPYGEDILAQLPSVPYNIPAEELAKREDLRGECIFTIDPATARDLDDALSCKQLANGNLLIGVHISDVTYFLREQSDLDELVKLRATSIYMVDTVYHMLPKQLCNTCSLLPGQDKLAFSVFWEMLPDGTVLSTRFARTVMNSCAQLSYEHAQMMLDNPKGDKLDEEHFPEILHGYTMQTLCTIVNQLQSIAVKIRQRRMDDGCLKINQPKLTFRLDPATGLPVEYGVYKLRPSNELIEDFMLLANTSVAKAIQAAFPSTSLLRNHKPPAENMMKNLVRTLASHGHKLSFASSKAIRESMEAIVASAEYPDAACSVLNVMLSKPMTRALYYCSAFASSAKQFEHYALAIPMYTHFTSPIRRYADCLVHRVLAAMLGIDDEPKRTPDELQKLATICNEKKYSAKLAGDASSMLYYRYWLQKVNNHDTVAAVLGYGSHFIELVLIHTGIVVKVSVKKISAGSSVAFKPTEPAGGGLQLIPKDTSIAPVTLKLFTKVRVTVKLLRGVICITSVLPMSSESDVPPTEEATAQQPGADLSNDVKSARAY